MKVKWLTGCRGQYSLTMITQGCDGSTGHTVDGVCWLLDLLLVALSVKIVLRLAIGASIRSPDSGRSHHQTYHYGVSCPRSAQVAPLTCIADEGRKGRAEHRMPPLAPTHLLQAQHIPTVLPNWETGEAHQDAREEPTWTACFCFGVFCPTSTFRGQNNLAFRVWLGCYILHANTARNLTVKFSIRDSKFGLQSSELKCSN